MYNTNLLNTSLLNSNLSIFGPSPADAISFNGFGLQNAEVTALYNQDNMPFRDFRAVPAPRADGQIITGDFWRKKQVKVEGTLMKTTNSELEAFKDEFRKKMSVREGNLDIAVDGVKRRLIATMINPQQIFAELESYHITWIPYSMLFECETPFARDIFYTTSSLFSQSSLTFNEDIVNEGTAAAQPIFGFVFSAASGITAITIINNTTSQEVVLTQSINAGDYVEFNAEDLEVRVNGTAVNFSGVLPGLDADTNSFTIALTGTSATFDFGSKYLKNYY